MHTGSKTATIAATTASVVAVTAAAVLFSRNLAHCIFSAEQLARQRAARYRKHNEDIPCVTSENKQTVDLQELVRSIFAKTNGSGQLSSSVRINRIEQDQDGEYILSLYVNDNEETTVDLMQFCSLVEDSQQIYTSTLVFLYDATGGQDAMVTKLLQTDDSVACCAERPPQWMKQYCSRLCLSNEKKTKVLRTLCRVEASRFPSAKRIVVPISTDYVSTLLPAIHSVFPDDKHIVLYTGCTQAVAKPNSMPLQPLTSIHMRTKEFHSAMAYLPFRVAAAVEAWMSAVDTMILMQDEFLSNSFLPYVCRLEYLLSSNDPVERRWAVRSLMQYCTGSEKYVERAIESMEPWSLESSRYSNAIDAVVFSHKRILIAHKTLPDTVPAVEHWSLKQQAGPGGCACCMEEDEEGETERTMIDAKVDSIMARSSDAQISSKYVDGKLGFAFDPSRFG